MVAKEIRLTRRQFARQRRDFAAGLLIFQVLKIGRAVTATHGNPALEHFAKIVEPGIVELQPDALSDGAAKPVYFARGCREAHESLPRTSPLMGKSSGSARATLRKNTSCSSDLVSAAITSASRSIGGNSSRSLRLISRTPNTALAANAMVRSPVRTVTRRS